MDVMRQYILNGNEATSVSSLRKKNKFGLGRLSLIFLFLEAPLLGHGSTESAPPVQPEYRLRFYHTHTGERLDVVYRRGDQYIPAALDELDHYLRDHRTGDVRRFDPRLFDLLYDLTASLGDRLPLVGPANCFSGGSLLRPRAWWIWGQGAFRSGGWRAPGRRAGDRRDRD